MKNEEEGGGVLLSQICKVEIEIFAAIFLFIFNEVNKRVDRSKGVYEKCLYTR